MTPEQFAELKQQNFTRIPLVHEVLADLDTPLSTYLKLANAPYTYLFESVHGGERLRIDGVVIDRRAEIDDVSASCSGRGSPHTRPYFLYTSRNPPTRANSNSWR